MERLILLKGMNPDANVFSRLASEFSGAEHVEWPSIDSRSSMTDLAYELISRYHIDRDCSLVGVSFGGIIAQEIAAIVHCKLCVVISTMCQREELPAMGRFLGALPVGCIYKLCLYGAKFGLFRKHGALDEVWTSWVVSRVVAWNAPMISSETKLIRIHGDRDRTFPNGCSEADLVLNGGHLIIATHADKISEVIRGGLNPAV